jgi:hypothetical protein
MIMETRRGRLTATNYLQRLIYGALLCLATLGLVSCGGGARKAPSDVEAAILNGLRTTSYGQGASDSIWAWAVLWAGSSSNSSNDATWTIESRDPKRVVWTVTVLVPSTEISASGKQAVLREGPRFFVDLEDWVAKLDLNAQGSQVMFQGMQSLGYVVTEWKLSGQPPRIP